MAENRGVFRLRTLRRENVQGDGVPVTDTWVPPAPIATSDASYMVGGLMNEWNSGSASDVSSQTDKITYSSSTTSRLPGGNLDNPMYGGVGMSSLLAMYSGGGPNVPGLNPNETNVRKLTYASETWALLPHATAGLKCEPKESTQGVGDASNFGYFFGATLSGTASYTQKFTFAYESSSRVPSADLPYSFYGATAAGTQDKAYVTGGSTGPWSSFKTNVTKFTYSGETMADVPGLRLSDDKYKGYGEAAAANTQYIWYAGGSQTSPQGGAIKGQTTVSRIDMSADTIQESLPSTQLTYPTFKHGGVDNGSDGYFAGGNSWNNAAPAGPGGPYSSANKLTFSNGTMAATPGANLTQAKSLMQTAGPRQYSTPSPAPGGSPYRWVDNLDPGTLNNGYWSGGAGPGGNSRNTDQVSFNSDLRSLLPSGDLPNPSNGFAGVLADTTKVLLTGGEPSGGDNNIQKFTYSTKTASLLPNAYPTNRRTYQNDMHSLVTPSLGYVVAGKNDSPNSYMSSTDKVSFATETSSAVPGANYSWAANWMGSWGNVDMANGYALGGFRDGQPGASTINKLTYATETLSNIPATLGVPNGTFQISAMSSATKGYLDGGRKYPGYGAIPADVMRFTFATDTMGNAGEPSYGGSHRFFNANATGTSTHGYSGGGQATSYPNRFSQVRKLSFTSETYSILPAAGSFHPGGGHYKSGAHSPVSNAKPLISEPTSTPTSDKFYSYSAAARGYYTGGPAPGAPSGNYVSNSERLDFSSDTFTVLPGMTVQNVSGSPYTLFRGASSTSSTNGYLLGGSGGGGSYYYSSIWKSTYASETTAKIPSNLSGTRYMHVAAGTTNKGYALGGNRPGIQSNVDKITYSNDSVSNIGNMPSGNRQRGGAASSPTALYASQSYYRTNFEKVTFASDTIAPIPSVNTPNPGASPSNYYGYGQIAGTGSQTQGYFGGGVWATPGSANSLLWKMTYSTDTLSSAPNLTGSKNYVRNTGDNAKGYFIGGSNPGPVATTTKFPFSTETFSTIPGTLQYPKSAGQGYGPRDQGVHEIGTPNVV